MKIKHMIIFSFCCVIQFSSCSQETAPAASDNTGTAIQTEANTSLYTESSKETETSYITDYQSIEQNTVESDRKEETAEVKEAITKSKTDDIMYTNYDDPDVLSAKHTAERYLDYTAFSRKSLIEQLIFEGYSEDTATKAVDNCDADWNEQAVAKAESYLNFTSFSKQGLIEQLEFEGFTHEQAEFGVSMVYVDSSMKTSSAAKTVTKDGYVTSDDQAIEKAKSYLSFTAFSKKGLIEQLEFEGFSASDAQAAVDKLDIDWNEQAVKKAKSYKEFMDFSYSDLVDQLEFEGFTHSQAVYGADNS